jgi:hypothetical protein
MRYFPILLVLTICWCGCGGDKESPKEKSIYLGVPAGYKLVGRRELDSLRSAAPPCTVYVNNPCLYSTESEICKVRGHDLTRRVGWSDFPNPFYDETYFECKWCGAIIRKIINSPAPDTAYKEKSPPTK